MLHHMRGGTIRIYDSTEEIPALAAASVFVHDASVPSTTDDSTDARTADNNIVSFWDDTDDALFIGRTTPFMRIKVDLDTIASADTGALAVTYWNGSTWASLTVTDGTASGGNTMRQDGYIYFDAPAAWVTGANSSDAALNSDEYYLRLKPTTYPATLPEADIIWPVDGQYFELRFEEGDLSAPEGRPRPEEVLIMHRENISTDMHYVAASERAVTDAGEVSFTVRVDDTYNKTGLRAALECANPNVDTNWDATGTTTKGDTFYIDVDGNSVTTPAFVDTSKKAVCVQILWSGSTAAKKVGRAYHEVYFDLGAQELSDGDEAVTISCTGTIYGAIEEITQFGYKY